ncbi:ABC-2 type transport system ATP-binding protein [Lachnotalea glycerini]|jgi:ABC-2 type transport system ATP-binding protein|uniref:ABC-2 type transport system ATP-binding protein n=1 Tax=Lachnotalea glycerini TaxID=1763509 RepID=A0A255IB97_9FIRM|nr:ATP-binding cassette domain-containing protein [Lachnotalea glycerini]PXV95709.1 ABC-2 type transport system ATP-binding protein [Lachnotalea glycerini]RDY33221.1 ATP-binding cassette domain-containing protein [Lachnotalea glycerini]
MNKIKVLHVGKRIREQIILNDINLEFQDSKIYGLIGRNGSGKTVLLKCIAGFMKPSEGEIWFNDKKIGKDVKFLENMGFILNTPGFLLELSGFKNLQYLASINRRAGKKEISEAMELVGLDPKNKKSVGKYSLGMRQRLGIAQAIMEDPEILILDEPMNSLDEQAVEEIRNILLQLKEKGKLIIITSHNKEDIEFLCDEVYQIRQGIIKKIEKI